VREGFLPPAALQAPISGALTAPLGRKYIASVVKRGDSSPRAEIHRAAEKGKSYLWQVRILTTSQFSLFIEVISVQWGS
jgi:hypothetical protein